MRADFVLVLLSLVIQCNAAPTSIGEAIKEKIEEFKNGFTSEEFHKSLERIREHVKEQLQKISTTVNQTALAETLKKIKEKIHEHIRPTGDSIEEVNTKLHVSGNYYQGDMLLTKEQAEILEGGSDVNKRQAFVAGAVSGAGKLWKTVYYSFTSRVPQHTQLVAEKAARFWHDNTCINFQHSNTQPDRISIFYGRGCFSNIGQVGGVQQLSLGAGCDSVSTAAHELGHSLGFFHTQSRHDRDYAITVMERNVKDGWLDQFDKRTSQMNDNYGMPYDYGSIMQYEGDSVSSNGQPTMIARVPQYQDTMGSDIVSFLDISMMNTLYNCKSICSRYSTTCYNGGFPHPRDCYKCICPSGYGGRYCNERPQGCGASLTATTAPQTLTYKIGNGSNSAQDDFVFCNWMITAPTSRRVEVTITNYTPNVCISGCKYGGIELKWKKDTTLTGSRYCCPNDVGERVISETNVLPLIAFNRMRTDTFTITYRAV